MSTRRSTRNRIPNKRYSTDAFADLGTFESDLAADEDEHETVENVENQQSDVQEDDVASDDDFKVEPQTEEGPDGDDVSVEDADYQGEEDRDDDEAEDEGEGRESLEEPLLHGGVEPSTSKARRGGPSLRQVTARSQIQATPTVRTRGLMGRPHRRNQERILIDTYGTALVPTIATSMEMFMPNSTFPQKKSGSGFAYSPGYGMEEASTQQQPLDVPHTFFAPARDAKTLLANSQSVTALSPSRGSVYLPRAADCVSLWAGPYQDPYNFSLSHGQYLKLDDAFANSQSKKLRVGKTTGQETGSVRKGWVINVGARILSLAWAPASKGGQQYLAVAVRQRPPSISGSSNPFVPDQGYCSSVQIWRFANEEDDREMAGDTEIWSQEPQAVHYICTEWGECRRLKWCPMLPVGIFKKGRQSFTNIGRLAAIWSDGYIRVVDVNLASISQQIFWQYQAPIFQAKPPGSVCTCVEWLSDMEVAAGCANGYVAIWNIKDLDDKRRETAEALVSPRPFFYHEFSETYILDIASAAPMNPHLLATNSVSGYQSLTDLRDPENERVHFSRSRVYTRSIRFSPHVRGFYSADDQGDVCFLGLRRFFSSRRVLVTTASPLGNVFIATSPVHTSVLAGTTDGIVVCTNPIRKQVDPRRGNAWSQKWFMHEWRAATDQDGSSDKGKAKEKGKARASSAAAQHSAETMKKKKKTSSDGQLDQTPGTVRMTEGYKMEKIGGIEQQGANSQKQSVIYSEEQAVTALEWNPNVDCGGWAAAGFGSGLVRVEDVGL